MAITIADVESPLGELDRAVLFPGDGTEADSVNAWQDRIAGYIADAASRSSSDDFAYHWVHYRAYHAKYIAMTTAPSSAGLPEGGNYSFTSAQIENMRSLADSHRNAAEDLLLVVAEVVHPSTRAVANEFVF